MRTVCAGDPRANVWETRPAADFPGVPWFRPAQLFALSDGGWRALLLATFQFYDTWLDRPLYCPLIWLEYVPRAVRSGVTHRRGLVLKLFIPGRGALALTVELFRLGHSWNTYGR